MELSSQVNTSTTTVTATTTSMTLEDCYLPSMFYTFLLCIIITFVGLARKLCRIDGLFMIYTMRLLSKVNGILIELYLPVCIRETIYGGYSKFAGVRTFEMEKDFKEYQTFQDFFSRHLQVGARTVDPLVLTNPSSLTSPCDGTIKSCGEIDEDGQIGFIKGQNFSLQQFMTGEAGSKDQHLYQKKVLDTFHAQNTTDEKGNKPRRLGYCVIYLGLGDYHRFHAPADIDFTNRRHIAGACFPVKDSFCENHPGVLNRNERVVLEGNWQGRYFSYSPVGAFNVGSIKVGFDPELDTNQLFHQAFSSVEEITYKPVVEESQKLEHKASAVPRRSPKVKRLEEIGYFAFGSTIVMVFELPQTYTWKVEEGETVRLGEILMQAQSIRSNSETIVSVNPRWRSALLALSEQKQRDFVKSIRRWCQR